MHDQPSSAELVGAAEQFLRDVAMKQLQGHAEFHARVAANALGIVKRELELGPKQFAAERKRLEELLDESGELEALNRELCRRIREGEVDMDTPGLGDHLWAATLEKLAIDQPKYSGYQKALEERGLTSKD